MPPREIGRGKAPVASSLSAPPDFPRIHSAQAAREAAATTLLDLLKQGYESRFFGLALFGSVARGTATEASDLDFIVCAAPLPDGRFWRIEEFDRLIEWPFREEWETRRGALPLISHPSSAPPRN